MHPYRSKRRFVAIALTAGTLLGAAGFAAPTGAAPTTTPPTTPKLSVRVQGDGAVRVQWSFSGKPKKSATTVEIQKSGAASFASATTSKFAGVGRRGTMTDKPSSVTYYRGRVVITGGITTAWSNTVSSSGATTTTTKPGDGEVGGECPTSYVTEVTRLVNVERAKVGAAPLFETAALDKSAMAWSKFMADNQAMVHGGSGWRGQNIAYGYGSAEAVMKGWVKSSGHYANIVRSWFSQIGVGCYQDQRGRLWWTQNFV
jgi:uncharacterized protein YkwD